MKITKQSESTISIAKETVYHLILENEKGKELEISATKYFRNDDYDYENELIFTNMNGVIISDEALQGFLEENDDDWQQLNEYIDNGCIESPKEIDWSYQELFNGILSLWKDGNLEPLDGDEVDTLCDFIKKEINKIEANN